MKTLLAQRAVLTAVALLAWAAAPAIAQQAAATPHATTAAPSKAVTSAGTSGGAAAPAPAAAGPTVTIAALGYTNVPFTIVQSGPYTAGMAIAIEIPTGVKRNAVASLPTAPFPMTISGPTGSTYIGCWNPAIAIPGQTLIQCSNSTAKPGVAVPAPAASGAAPATAPTH